MTMPIDFDNIGQRHQPRLVARRGGRGSFAPSKTAADGSTQYLKTDKKVSSRELNPYIRMKAGMDPGRFKKIGPTMPPKGALEGPGSTSIPSRPDNSAMNSLLREERASAGDLDKTMMKQIAKSGGAMDDTDGMEQVADDMEARQSREEDPRYKKFKRIKTVDDKHGRTSIEDYVKKQDALEKCFYCLPPSGPAKIPVISLGNTCYLALNNQVSVTKIFIIPCEHLLTMLDCPQETWDEIRNFMKCLMHMYHKTQQSIIFVETVSPFKQLRHAAIECIPVPDEVMPTLSGYYKSSLMDEAESWSQNKPVIDTSRKGFRHTLTPKLPYFHVWLDLDGGIGHIIEGERFPRWLGREVVAKVLDLGPEMWRHPKRLGTEETSHALKRFIERWKPFDWTAMLEGGAFEDESKAEK